MICIIFICSFFVVTPTYIYTELYNWETNINLFIIILAEFNSIYDTGKLFRSFLYVWWYLHNQCTVFHKHLEELHKFDIKLIFKSTSVPSQISFVTMFSKTINFGISITQTNIVLTLIVRNPIKKHKTTFKLFIFPRICVSRAGWI